MKSEDLSRFTDSQLVQYFRDASLERAKCGFNWRAGNRIFDNKIVPAYKALAGRGQNSLRALLSLTDDPSPHVRTDAAILTYNADPVRCRESLKKVIAGPGWVGALALGGLLHKDPESSAEFSRQAELDYRKYLEERNKRHPPAKEE